MCPILFLHQIFYVYFLNDVTAKLSTFHIPYLHSCFSLDIYNIALKEKIGYTTHTENIVLNGILVNPLSWFFWSVFCKCRTYCKLFVIRKKHKINFKKWLTLTATIFNLSILTPIIVLTYHLLVSWLVLYQKLIHRILCK